MVDHAFDALQREHLDVLDAGIACAETLGTRVAVEIAHPERFPVGPDFLHPGVFALGSAHSVVDAVGERVIGQQQFAQHFHLHHDALFPPDAADEVSGNLVGLFAVEQAGKLLGQDALHPGRILDSLRDEFIDDVGKMCFGLLPLGRTAVPAAVQPGFPSTLPEQCAYRH